MPLDPTQFLGLPPCDLEQADVVILPLPLEKTVTYGTGTWRGPRRSSKRAARSNCSTRKRWSTSPSGPQIHTLPPLRPTEAWKTTWRPSRGWRPRYRDKFLLALGGEHTVTYGVIDGLADDLGEVTIVQIDAHADLADELDGPPLVARHRDAAALGAGMPAGADRHPQPLAAGI